MSRREQRIRLHTATRTYPVYAISTSELTNDDENIIEIKPLKRYQHHRKQRSKVKPQEANTSPIVTGKI